MMDLIATTPKMDLGIQDMAPLVEALRASHAIYSPLLQRREPRAAAPSSRQGVLATWPRKSIEPMVRAVDGVAPKAVRAMPSLSSAGQWHAARRWHQPWKEGATARGAADGGRMVAGRDVPQQGVHAGGVQRQDGGARGQRAHCPAGVWVGSGSAPGDPVRDRRLSGPTAWRTDDA